MQVLSSEELMEFINFVAVKKESHLNNRDDKKKSFCWYSKTDGSYITLDGMTDWQEDFKMYLKHGITEQIQTIGSIPENSPRSACLGFNPIKQKWFGWSHRAVYGFGIGSECKEGNCGYVPYDEQDAIKAAVRFWTDGDNRLDVQGKIGEDDEGEGVRGVQVTWLYPESTPNEKLRGTRGGSFMYFPDEWGKGEWKAETLEDAKQMAIDFADSVG